MRPQKTLDEDVLAGLTEVFQSKGYEAASLQDLARATGLKKASLYHRFPGGKKQMAEEKEDKPLSRRERFKKYRDKRLYQAVRAIKLCENMANKNSYDYTEEESSIIIRNIREAFNDLQHAFKKGEKKTKFFS